MATLELPRTSKTLIVVSVAAIAFSFSGVIGRPDAAWSCVIPAFFISGFLADAFTGLAHFCFDYVFPESFPIFGPIAREFREHHEYPTLDPSNYVET